VLSGKVLLDACTSTSILRCNDVIDGASTYELDAENTSLITDIHVITDILLEWTVWKESPEDVWLLAFRAVNSLVRPTQKYLQYHLELLQSADVISRLLNISLVSYNSHTSVSHFSTPVSHSSHFCSYTPLHLPYQSHFSL